jgi:hypothetical protein
MAYALTGPAADTLQNTRTSEAVSSPGFERARLVDRGFNPGTTPLARLKTINPRGEAALKAREVSVICREQTSVPAL